MPRNGSTGQRSAPEPDRSSQLEVVYRPLKSLKPYAKNARQHPRPAIERIKGSLAKFGWTNPMLVADGSMIAGHGRLQAALELAEEGVEIPRLFDKWTGPTIDLSHLTPTERRAYVIADNKLPELSLWDQDILAEELGALNEDGFDLGLIGFDDQALAELLGGTGPGADGDPDAPAPEPPVHPVSLSGDVWLLGKHRILCGDSTKADNVAKALAGTRPLLMVTDPPYGVEYDPAWRDKVNYAPGRARGKVQNDDRSDWREAWALFPGDVAYVWHGEKQVLAMGAQLEAAGFECRNLIVWAKNRHTFGRGHYHSQHETAWYAVRKSGKAHWAGDRTQTTVWQVDKPMHNETGHGTQKPVDCMARPIQNNSSPGQVVYEPFSGSGTTIVACEQLGRACVAIEIDAAYVDVAVRRWEQLTNQQATLEGDGRTFAEISAERVVSEAAD